MDTLAILSLAVHVIHHYDSGPILLQGLRGVSTAPAASSRANGTADGTRAAWAM
jgi:hypothetical protein